VSETSSPRTSEAAPDELLELSAQYGPPVLAYCTVACRPGMEVQATVDAFLRLRDRLAASDRASVDVLAALLAVTREAAAATVPTSPISRLLPRRVRERWGLAAEPRLRAAEYGYRHPPHGPLPTKVAEAIRDALSPAPAIPLAHPTPAFPPAAARISLDAPLPPAPGGLAGPALIGAATAAAQATARQRASAPAPVTAAVQPPTPELATEVDPRPAPEHEQGALDPRQAPSGRAPAHREPLGLRLLGQFVLPALIVAGAIVAALFLAGVIGGPRAPIGVPAHLAAPPAATSHAARVSTRTVHLRAVHGGKNFKPVG
jgi:hypothetical protein